LGLAEGRWEQRGQKCVGKIFAISPLHEIMSRRKGEEGVAAARGTRQKYILYFDEKGESLRNTRVLWSIILKLILSRMARRGLNLSGSEWGQMSGSCEHYRGFFNI